MTIETVAEMAGVSKATVSRVLNGNTSVSREKTQKVKLAISRSGYIAKTGRKNNIQKFLKGKNIASIYLSHSEFESPMYFADGLRGAMQAADELGLNLFTAKVSCVEDIPEFIHRKQAIGILLNGQSANQKVIETLEESNIPFLWSSSHWNNRNRSTILSGNEFTANIAIDYFLSHACRNIVYFNVFPNLVPVTCSRGEFFEFLSKKHQIKVNSISVSFESTDSIPKDFMRLERCVSEQITKICNLPQRPDGLFLATTSLIGLTYRLLREHGIEPMRDIDIISIDNDPFATLGVSPKPARIDMGAFEMGKRAVMGLVDKITNETNNRLLTMIEPRLIPGEIDPNLDRSNS